MVQTLDALEGVGLVGVHLGSTQAKAGVPDEVDTNSRPSLFSRGYPSRLDPAPPNPWCGYGSLSYPTDVLSVLGVNMLSRLDEHRLRT